MNKIISFIKNGGSHYPEFDFTHKILAMLPMILIFNVLFKYLDGLFYDQIIFIIFLFLIPFSILIMTHLLVHFERIIKG